MQNKKFFKINMIYFIAMLLICVWFILGYCGIIKNDYLSVFLIQIVTMLSVPLLLYTLFCSKNIKQTFKDAGFKKISFKAVALVIALGIVLYFLNGYIASFFQGFIKLLGWENLYGKFSSSIQIVDYKFLLIELICSCLLPAICEEFIHRGILLHANKKFNKKFCLYMSSLLFGLIHLNINQFFYAAILGFIMGYINIMMDSIYPSIIIHFLNNSLSLYMTYGVYFNFKIPKAVNFIEYLFHYNLVIYIITSISATILLCMIVFALINSLKKEKQKQDIKKLKLHLQQNNIELKQATEIVNNFNLKLQQSNTYRLPNKKKPAFAENVFLISSIVLGGLVTLSSFIWGLI